MRCSKALSGKRRDAHARDSMSAESGGRCFDADPGSWLVGEAIARLHSDDCEGQSGYRRAIELMTRLGAADAVGTVLAGVEAEDIGLRWSLLYVLAETGDPKASELFAGVAIEPIRVERESKGCYRPQDGEVLVRTMAIDGLGRLAQRDGAAVDLLFKVVEAQSDRALRIEATKAILAAAPDAAERLRETLPEDLHFALSLRRVRAQTLAVDYEPAALDAVRAMPSLDGTNPRPTTRNCDCC